MFAKKVTVVIDRPLDEVFAFVGDVRNRPSWDDSVDSEELTSAEPIGVGTTVRTRLTSMGRQYEYTWAIVEHEPPHAMKVESTSGPFPTTLVFHFDGRDDGTLVEASVTARPAGLMRLLEPMIARTTQKNLDRGYGRLKQLLETGVAAQPPTPRSVRRRQAFWRCGSERAPAQARRSGGRARRNPFSRLELRRQRRDDLGVELGARAALQLGQRLVRGQLRSPRLGARHRLEGVGDEQDSRRQRDPLAGQPLRVATPVPPLVVMADPGRDRIGAERLEHGRPDLGMALDGEALVLGQRARLPEHVGRQRQLADVAQDARQADELHMLDGQLHAHRDARRHLADTVGSRTERVEASSGHCSRERLRGVQEGTAAFVVGSRRLADPEAVA